MSRFWLRLLCLAGSLAGAAAAQTASCTILGTVRDAQDAIIPGARVVATNDASNVSRTFTTGATGQYAIPFLLPGQYTVTVEAQGFRAASRTGITLRVNDALVVDFMMEVGAITEKVTVSGEAPLLETMTNTLGQVVENRRIVDLPLNGREPFSLAQLVPGVLPVPRGQAPMHLGGSIPSINGAINAGSEVLLDGATNTVPRNAIYLLIHTPSVDAVEEFKVETNSLSAEYGRFNGGVISVMTKSGTNALRGSAYWFHRNSEFDANDFFNNRSGIPLGNLRRHQAGFTAGGPVYVPKLYDGRNRTFFFTDYEGFREAAIAPSAFTVPTAAERAGDFSKTLNSQGRPVIIYDPQTLSPVGTTPRVRQPFAGNIIPANRISAVSRRLTEFYPVPANDRVVGNLPLGAARNNRTDTWDARFDHNFSQAHRFFVRLSLQNPQTGEPNYYGNIANPTNPPLVQRRRSATMQTTHTVSPTLIVNLHYGLSHMFGGRKGWSKDYDITQLGMAANYRDGQQSRGLPATSVSGYSSLGNNLDLYSTQTGHTFQVAATKISGGHTMKAGYEYRAYYNNTLQNSETFGTLQFSPGFTQGPDPNQASATAGNGLATMLLGHPSGGRLTIQPALAVRGTYQAGYFQDNWRLHPRFTLNLGLRYDIVLPRTERYDRVTVFDAGVASPIASRVPSLPGLRGVLTVRDGNNRRLTESDKNNWGPRIGFAWQPLKNTAIRAGYGIFYGLSPTDASLTNAYADGFTASTSVIASLDGVTPIGNVANPYPDGISRPRTRSEIGPDLFLGQDITSLILDFATPYFQQWNFSIQQSVGDSMLVQAAYVAGKGTRNTFPALNVNALTPEQMALGTANQALVANPFFGVITDPTSVRSRPTIARGSLLLPYPQYGVVRADYPSLGSSIYHSFQAKVERRMSKGFTLLTSLTIAKGIDDASQDQYGPVTGVMDVTNLKRERSITPQDVAQRLVVSGVWELPVGRGQAIGNSWSKAMDLLLGGWQFNGIASFQGGLPLVMSSTGGTRPNRVATGTPPSGPIQQNLLRAFDISAFAVPAAFTYGNSSRTAPDLRWHGINNFDLSLFKTWRILAEGRLKAQFRIESFNTFNRTQFNTPGTQTGSTAFGVITSQYNVPRQLQLALKLLF